MRGGVVGGGTVGGSVDEGEGGVYEDEVGQTSDFRRQLWRVRRGPSLLPHQLDTPNLTPSLTPNLTVFTLGDRIDVRVPDEAGGGIVKTSIPARTRPGK